MNSNLKTPVSSVQQQTPQPIPVVSYFDGSTIGLIGHSILFFLITFVTLGWGYPWAKCMLIRWQVSHTVVGNQRLQFNGTGDSLFGKWFIWGLLTVISLGLYGIVAPVRFERWKAERTFVSKIDNSPKPKFKSNKSLLIIIIPVIVIIYGIVIYFAVPLIYEFINTLPIN